MIERQVIVTWHTPEEKLPPVEQMVVASISGRRGNITFDHTFAIVEWWGDEGWIISDWIISEDDLHMDEFVVHAWCDLEPYGGKS